MTLENVMKATKVMALGLAAAVTVLTAGGCQLSFGNNYVFKIDKESCSAAEAKVFLVNYQNQYRQIYGVDMWRDGAEKNSELETYIKDLTISRLAEVYTMDLIGQDREMELSEEELAHVSQAAETYYDSLNETEKEYFGISFKEMQQLYERFAMAKKVYKNLTAEVDQEVSDDDARVMQLQQIFVVSEERAKQIHDSLLQGGDFAQLAAAYNEASSGTVYVDRSDFTDEQVEEQIFDLKNGAFSEVIPAENGYYIYYCVNNFEQELTEKNKAQVLSDRMEAAVDNTYDDYAKGADSRLNEKVWDKIGIDTSEALATQGFFETFEQYCGADYAREE